MSIYLETANKQIKKGIVGLDVIKSNLTKHYLELDKQEFQSKLKAEYNELYPTHTKPMEVTGVGTDIEASIEERKEDDRDIITDKWVDEDNQDYSYKIAFYIDYSEDENYKTFEEYKNETRVVSEAVYFTYEEYSESFNSEFEAMMTEEEYNNNPIKATEEVAELVRPYIPNDVSDKVDEYISTHPTYLARLKEEALKTLDITTLPNGLKFHTDDKSLLDLMIADREAEKLGATNENFTDWKTADGVKEVSIGDIRNAIATRLQNKAKIVGVAQ